MGMRRACMVVRMQVYLLLLHGVRDDRALRRHILEVAETMVRYGYKRIHVLLRREGWHVNHKKV